MSENSRLYRFFDYFYKKLKFERRITRENVSYLIPVRKGVGLQNFIAGYENWFTNILKNIELPPGSSIVDVGANTGQTLLKIVPYFPSINYIAVEPNTYCNEYLADLCNLNHFKNVQVMPYALSDIKKKLNLFYRYREDMLATTTPGYRKYTNYSNYVEVEAITGDELCNMYNISNISLIKIDVEGGEYEVVKGFKRHIISDRPYIVCEILPVKTESEEVTKYRIELSARLLDIFSQMDYTIINIETGTPVTSVDNLSDEIQSCNYICVPAEKKDFVKRIPK